LLKNLVESGWEVATAWNAVCNSSRKLGHYWDSEDALHGIAPTGFMEVCGYSDLANVHKLLAEDKEAGGVWYASGTYNLFGYNAPIAIIILRYGVLNESNYSVGWLVLEK